MRVTAGMQLALVSKRAPPAGTGAASAHNEFVRMLVFSNLSPPYWYLVGSLKGGGGMVPSTSTPSPQIGINTTGLFGKAQPGEAALDGDKPAAD